MSGTQRSVRTRLTIDVNDYIAGTQRAEGATKRFGGSATSVLKGVATGYAAIKVGGLVADSVRLEAQYSKTMAQVAVATRAPQSELKSLDKLALQMGKNTVFSAQDSAQAMLELAKGGLSTAQIKAGALSDTLTLASAGGLALDEASKAVVNSMGAFQLKASQTDEAVAALAGSANASSADVSDMTQALAQAGTSAHSAGLSIQDTTAYLALLANQGIKGSDAGTSLRTMLSRLVPQTKQARDAMKSLHLSYVDGNGQLVSATEIAGRTQKAFKGLSDEERIRKTNAIFGSDAQRTVNAITTEGEKGLRKYITSTSDLTQAQQLAKAANSGTAGAIENLKGSIETAEIQIGKGLAPTVRDLADHLNHLASSGDVEKWASNAAAGVTDFAHEVTPLAKSVVELGREALPVANDALHVTVDVLEAAAAVITPLVEGFNKLPDAAQKALILAAGAQMLGRRMRGSNSDALVGAGNLLTFGANAETAGTKSAKGAVGVGRLKTSLKGTGALLAVTFGAPIVLDGLNTLGNSLGQLGDQSDRFAGKVDRNGHTSAAGLKAIQDALAGGNIGKYADDLGVDLDKLAIDMAKNGDQGKLYKQTLADLGDVGDSVGERLKLIGKNPINPDWVKARDAESALKDVGKELDRTAEAARRNRLAVDENLNGYNLLVSGLGQYADELDGLPTKAVTEITTPGAVKSKEDVLELQKKFDLTPKQVRTIMKALDLARPVIKAVNKALNDIDGKTSTVTIKTIKKTIDDMKGTGKNSPGVDLFRAGGGAINGPGTGTSDSILARVSTGEHVITADEVQAAGGQGAIYAMRAMLRAGRVPKFAGGGAVGSVGSMDPLVTAITRLAAALVSSPALSAGASSNLDLIHQRQQVRDLANNLTDTEVVGKGKHKHRRLVLRGLDREAARLELADAKQQLATMKATNAELAKYGSLKSAQLRLDQAAAATDFAGNVTLTGTSTAGVDRNLTRMISDAAEFTEILGGLKAKGASPWLLQQLIAAGPTRTAIRLGRQYLNDSAALANINAKTQLLNQVSSAYGALTADPRFSADKAWGGLTSTTKTTLVKIEALDVSNVTSEIQRVVRHELATIADGGGA